MFARPWRDRRRDRRDDAGSMPLAMLVTLVGVTLSASVSGLVISQIKSSQLAANRVAAVAAAQAGLDAELAGIRSATNVTQTAGVLARLPCGVAAAALPSLGGATTTQPAYSASIAYFLSDPTSRVNALAPLADLSQVSSLVNGTTVQTLLGAVPAAVVDSVNGAVQGAVACTAGFGLTQSPAFSLLKSVGTVGTVKRTLYATYTFHTTNETITGGHIVIAGTGDQFCLGATSGTATSGNPVIALPCTSNENLIRFIYPQNLSLSLANSRTSGSPYGICITSPPAPLANNLPVTFTACTAPTYDAAGKLKPPNPLQMWDYEVNQQTYFGTTDGTSSDGYCLSTLLPVISGKAVVLLTGASYCGTAGATGRAFVPDAAVGPGGAGVGSDQLVNFQEVGRCLDLTNEDPMGVWFTSRGLTPALITYPCKQSFTGVPYWNHLWVGPTINPPLPSDDPATYKGTGTIMMTPTTGAYVGQQWCMRSPGPGGGYVWVALCSTGGASVQWTVTEYSSLFSDAYQVIDAHGKCLEAAGSLGTAYLYLTFSEVITATCDGSDIQKWNAPRSVALNPLTGIQER